MRVRLKLFFKWGIKFDEAHPYAVPEHGNREVQYAEKREIQEGIMKKYHPEDYEAIEHARKNRSGGEQFAQQPPYSDAGGYPSKAEKRNGGNLKTEPAGSRAPEEDLEVKADE